jgi:modulator of FtsH protease
MQQEIDMNDNFPRSAYLQGTAVTSPETRNRVLRNTYWLLALSMIPTVAGAWVGLQMGLGIPAPGQTHVSAAPLMLMFVGMMGLIFAIQRFRNSSIGVGLLLGFTFLEGMWLSILLGFVLAFSNGVALITLAFGGTAITFAAMATIGTISKRDFSSMGRFLFIGLIVIVLAGLANIFLQIPALMLTISVLAIVIFSAFLMYDVQRVVNGGETNYVSATLAIYLDLINIFSNLLMLLGIFGGNRD